MLKKTQELENKQSAILQIVPDPFVMVDLNSYRLCYANHQMKKILKLNVDDNRPLN